MTELFKSAVAWLRTNWFRRPAGVVFPVVVVVATVLVEQYLKSASLAWPHYALALLLGAIAVVAWIGTRRPPRAARNTVAIAIAIRTEDEQEQRKLRADFIETMREVINRGPLQGRFTVVPVPEFLAARIQNEDDADRYSRRAAWHFLLHGRARLRTLNGKPHHILNLNGLVRHGPVRREFSQRLSLEFRELVPPDIRINSENDLLAFEFAADYLAHAATYIVAIAAFLSGHLDYSQSLYEGLQATAARDRANFPLLQKIRTRLPTRLSEVYATQAALCHRKWCETRLRQDLEQMMPFLDKLQALVPSHYSAHLLRAIADFVISRDVGAAIKEIRKCRDLNLRDSTWRLSYAFLLAYRGEVYQAYQQYQIAFRGTVEPSVVLQAEDFICWLAEREPDKPQLHFCLGILNFYVKQDTARALDEFLLYLAKTTDADSSQRKPRVTAQQLVPQLRRALEARLQSEDITP